MTDIDACEQRYHPMGVMLLLMLVMAVLWALAGWALWTALP